MTQEDRRVAARLVREVNERFGRIKKVIGVAVASNDVAMATVLLGRGESRRFRLVQGVVVDEDTIGD